MALHRDRPVSRAELAAQLWPDSPDAQALANLRTLLYRLPPALPSLSPFVVGDTNWVRWRGGLAISLDVAEFEAAVHAGSLISLRAAVDLYRGDLLPEIGSEWVLGERERLRVLFAEALRRLAERLLICGDLQGARLYGERLIGREPAGEEGWRLLMRIRALQDGPAAVAEVFGRCRAALVAELGVEPAAATRQLRDRLADGLGRRPPGGTAGAMPAQELFVGRQAELAACEGWLAGQGPVVLYVHGPAGTGKTALLRAVARMAASGGRDVRWLDGADPAALGRSAALLLPVARAEAPLLVGDAVTSLAPWLAEADRLGCPDRAGPVRLLLAGRSAPGPAWDAVRSWRSRVLTLRLGPLSAADAHEYLRRLGLADPRLAGQLLAASGNHPGALSRGAALLRRTGSADLHVLDEWPAIVHELAREFTSEGGDSGGRQLLEAGALIRHLEPDLLGAMCDMTVRESDIDALGVLSACRPTPGGLQLDAGARRLLAQDLRWRRPERYLTLRRRAFAFYRARLAGVVGAERRRICGECLFLWDQERTLAALSADGEPDGVTVEPGGAGDHASVRRIWARWLAASRAASPTADGRDLQAVLAFPGTRLRLARDSQGELLGFSAVVPVCSQSLAMLLGSGTTAPLVEARWPARERAGLPATAAESRLLLWRCLAFGDRDPEAAHAALWWDLLSLVAEADALYAATPVPAYAAALEALGFRQLPGADSWNNGALHPVRAYELDMGRIGLDGWLAQRLGFAAPAPAGGVPAPVAQLAPSFA